MLALSVDITVFLNLITKVTFITFVTFHPLEETHWVQPITTGRKLYEHKHQEVGDIWNPVRSCLPQLLLLPLHLVMPVVLSVSAIPS